MVEEEEVVDHELLHWRQVANDERSDRLVRELRKRRRAEMVRVWQELEERKRRLVERIRVFKLEMHAANMEEKRQEQEVKGGETGGREGGGGAVRR